MHTFAEAIQPRTFEGDLVQGVLTWKQVERPSPENVQDLMQKLQKYVFVPSDEDIRSLRSEGFEVFLPQDQPTPSIPTISMVTSDGKTKIELPIVGALHSDPRKTPHSNITTVETFSGIIPFRAGSRGFETVHYQNGEDVILSAEKVFTQRFDHASPTIQLFGPITPDESMLLKTLHKKGERLNIYTTFHRYNLQDDDGMIDNRLKHHQVISDPFQRGFQSIALHLKNGSTLVLSAASKSDFFPEITPEAA